MAGKKLNLLADFPAVSTEEWMAKITADLKGVPFEKKLIWKTDEGFNVNPFYRQEDVKGMAALDSAPGKFPFVRGTKESNEWLVRQNICVECPKEANAKALDVLTKGVNSLGFCLSKDDLNAETIATLLKGICPECVELNFNICPCSSETLINLLVDYFRKNNVNLEKVHGSVNCDPMKNMLAKGRKPSMEKMATHIVAAVKAAECMPEFRVVAVNSAVLNHAGAFCAQELGYALAWGAEYMTLMTEAGIKSVRAGRAIKFNMGVAGVAWATVISQCVSAVLVLITLLRARGTSYRYEWKKTRVDKKILGQICKIGLPSALQMAITAFSNVFVQGYMVGLGTDILGGWTTYSKVDAFALLPMQSIALALTTFLGQNLGAGNVKRAKKGTNVALVLSISVTALCLLPIIIWAGPISSVFNKTPGIVEQSVIILRWLSPFYLLCCFNQIYAGALRGAGDSRAPMFIMLGSFVVLRQIYLFVIKRVAYTTIPVVMGYPLGWLACSLACWLYYRFAHWEKHRVTDKQGDEE